MMTLFPAGGKCAYEARRGRDCGGRSFSVNGLAPDGLDGGMVVLVLECALALAARFPALLAAEFFDGLAFGCAFSLDDGFVGIA